MRAYVYVRACVRACRTDLQAADLPGAVCVGAPLRLQLLLHVFEAPVEQVPLQLGPVPLLASRQQVLLQAGDLRQGNNVMRHK